MKNLRLTLAITGAAALLAGVAAYQPASATVVPNGSEAISSGGATVNTTNITSATSSVSLVSPFALGLFTDPFLANPNNFCSAAGNGCTAAHTPGFLLGGDAVTLSTATLPVTTAPSAVSELVTITNAAAQSVDFQFTEVFLSGAITPTTATTSGSFNLGLTGTFHSDSTGLYTLGESASFSVACTQSGLGATVGCGLSIATPPVLAPPDVPEPASLALLGSALVGFGVFRRRRKGS